MCTSTCTLYYDEAERVMPLDRWEFERTQGMSASARSTYTLIASRHSWNASSYLSNSNILCLATEKKTSITAAERASWQRSWITFCCCCYCLYLHVLGMIPERIFIQKFIVNKFILPNALLFFYLLSFSFLSSAWEKAVQRIEAVGLFAGMLTTPCAFQYQFQLSNVFTQLIKYRHTRRHPHTHISNDDSQFTDNFEAKKKKNRAYNMYIAMLADINGRRKKRFGVWLPSTGSF